MIPPLPSPSSSNWSHQGKVHFILISGGGGGPGRGGASSAITQWATTHATPVPATSYGNDASAGTLYQLS